MIESWTKGWSDSHTGWTKTHLSMIQYRSTQTLSGNLTCFKNRCIDTDLDINWCLQVANIHDPPSHHASCDIRDDNSVTAERSYLSIRPSIDQIESPV
jgi:hypothetical protein